MAMAPKVPQKMTLFWLVLGKIACDQTDDEGIVARQHEVDQDNDEQRREERARKQFEFHESLQQQVNEGRRRTLPGEGRSSVCSASRQSFIGTFSTPLVSAELSGRKNAPATMRRTMMPPAMTLPASISSMKCQ